MGRRYSTVCVHHIREDEEMMMGILISFYHCQCRYNSPSTNKANLKYMRRLFKNRLWTALYRLYWEYHAHWWPRPDSTNNLTFRIRGLGDWNTKSLPCDWLERVIHFPTLQSGLFVDSGVEVAKAAPVNCSAVEICKIFHFAKIWVASHESQLYLNVSLVAELAAGTPDKCDPDIK